MKRLKRLIAGLSAAALTAALCTPTGVCGKTYIELIPETGSARITVNADKGHKTISPYIYGINDTGDLSGISPTVIKQKGAELTTYNWEANCSNTGAAGKNINGMHLVDDYAPNRWTSPALYADKLSARGTMNNIRTRLITLPMMGYVAKDSMGIVSDDLQSRDSRWCRVFFSKNDTYLNLPDTSDGAVYADEYVSYLINRFGTASEGGIKGYFLDSEPDKWTENFPVLGLPRVDYEELAQRSAELAGVVKTLDGSALVFGPSLSGLQGCINLRNPNAANGDYSWFVDYYLSQMQEAEKREGQRLLDVFDSHYYTEAVTPTGEKIISNSSEYCNTYRMQAVRTLWDPDYIENDETVILYSQFTPVIPTLQASIRMNYPGTKLSFSEYDFGGGDNISGAVAQADALGVFASHDVYMACLSPSSDNYDYQKAALNMFTDYDSIGSGFGDTLVYSDNGGDIMSSVYAATDSAEPEKLRIMLINKQSVNSKDFSIEISSDKYSYSAESVYSISGENSSIVKENNAFSVNDNNITFTAEETGVYLLVLGGKKAEGTSFWDNYTTKETIEPDDTETEVSDTEETDNPEDTSFETATDTEPPATDIEPYQPSAEPTAPPVTDAPPETDSVAGQTSVCEAPFTEDITEEITEGTSEAIPVMDPDVYDEKHVPAAVKVVVSSMALTVIGGVIYILFFDRK